jgi:ABC-type branched-subunit amino acid transport system substrate-binding protein
VALVVAGCGSSGNEGGGTTAQADQTTTSSCGTPPSGEPIVVAEISDVTGYPGAPWGQFTTGAEAAAEYINEDLCGVDGRPFEIWSCDSKYDGAAAASCASQALEQDPVAQTGLSVLLGMSGAQIFKKAGIVTMNVPILPPDFANTNNWALGGGAVTELPAMGYYVSEVLGKKKIAMLMSDDAAGHQFSDQITAALKAGGATEVNTTFVRADVTDLTPSVVKMTSEDPEFIITVIFGDSAVRLYEALAQQGYPADQTMNASTGVDVELFEDAGDAIEGGYFTAQSVSFDDLDDPEVKIYRDAMERYSDVEGRSAYYQWGFANVMMIYEAAKAVGGEDFDAASYKQFLESSEELPIFMGYELSQASVPAIAPSVRNPYLRVVQWKDGELLDAGSGWFVAPGLEPN